MKNKILLITIGSLAFLNLSGLLAQTAAPNLRDVRNPVYPSPTAASLGKYSDMPVSYHTGVPSINIPIYTLIEGSLELPISLSYHSAGIRVDETASAVGLGWSLNAGGMISRTVNGGPDEGLNHSQGLTPKNGWGFYKDGDFPDEIIACASSPANNYDGPAGPGTCPPPYSTTCKPCHYWYHDAAIGAIDLEPDLYSFNVNGYSGKFFFDKNRKVHMVNESDVYIKPIDSPNIFESWLIITPDGVKYYFGNYGGVNATEKSYADPTGLFTNFSDFVANTTWYLTKVENGDRWIKIEYDDEYYSFGNRKGQTYNLFEAGSSPSMADPILAVSYVQGKRIKRITTSSGLVTINFKENPTSGREDLNYAAVDRYTDLTRNSEAKAISAIEIVSTGFYKKFNLIQDYFSASPCYGCQISPNYNAIQHSKRLRLNRIVEVNEASGELPPYIFNYFTHMPSRYSLGRDAQGYYNGKDYNDGWIQDGTQIANYAVPLTTGDDHLPSEADMKAGMLFQMRHPLGRVTTFNYEAHRTTPTNLIGGLRIKSIKEDDANSASIFREFAYENPKLYFDDNPSYSHYVNQNNVDFPNNPDHPTYNEYVSTSPVVPLFSAQGYSIAYDKVTEKQAGNGSRIYTYYSFPQQFSINRKFPDVPLTTSAGSSELNTENVKDANNNSVAFKEYTKANIGTSQVVVGRRVGLATTTGGVGNPPSPLLGWPYYQDYTVSSNRFLTTVEKVTKDGIISETTFTYDGIPLHNNPRKTEMTDSNGILNRVENSFASDGGFGVPLEMFTSTHPNFTNMLGMITEQKSYSNGVIRSRLSNQFSSRGRGVLLTSTKNYPSGLTEFVDTQLEYNNNFDVINMSASNAGINKGYQWGYNNSLPVAEVTNAQNTKYGYLVNSIGTVPISVFGSSPQTTSTNFTVDYTGTVKLKLGLTTSPAYTIYADYTSALGSNTIILAIGCTSAEIVFSNVLPGSYTINLTIRATSTGVTVNACGEIQFPDFINATTGITEFLYESFESGPGTGVATPHTGKKYYVGDYTISFTVPNSRNYLIEYWYMDTENVWIYISKTYSGTSMVLSEGIAIDDVRIYPRDARMKSYTYEPGLGLTSIIDENGSVLNYNYDSFGRLRQVKNEKGEIEKQYSYNYKTN